MAEQEREAVGSLARWFHNEGDGGIWESFDWSASVEVARAVLASDWLAGRDAALIAEAKAGAWHEGFMHARFAYDGVRLGSAEDNPYRADQITTTPKDPS